MAQGFGDSIGSTVKSRRTFVTVTALFVAFSSCSKSPTAPSTALAVSSISPAQGSTTGSTNVSISGNNFARDATVTVRSDAEKNVALHGSTVLTAVLGATASAGPVDVVVTSGGRTATLARAFTFVAPSGTNQPPVVTSMRSIGSRTGQPSGFADQDETVTIITTV